MREIFFPGFNGRIEGRHTTASQNKERAALILHSHPSNGGSFSDTLVQEMYHTFLKNEFSVLCTNFRSVGKSEGVFNNGYHEVVDSSLAIDWLTNKHQNIKILYVVGVDFGARIALELVMRRPEITNFVSISTPCTKYDFAFLSPCPASGIIVHGADDSVTPIATAREFADKISKRQQTGKIHQKVDFYEIAGGDHFFRNKIGELNAVVDEYIDNQLHHPKHRKRTTNTKF